MATIEDRLQRIEDRQALSDPLNAYCGAVDSLSDVDALLACFTEDAVFDLSGIHRFRQRHQRHLAESRDLPAIRRAHTVECVIDIDEHAAAVVRGPCPSHKPASWLRCRSIARAGSSR